jgi:FtsH-binding integral membrane protein
MRRVSATAVSNNRDRSQIWFAVVGAVLGLAVGIVVSATTDVPLAPEAGLVLGFLVGWFSRARRHRPLSR